MARTDYMRIVWKGDSGSPPGNLSPTSFHGFPDNRVVEAKALVAALESHTLCEYAFLKYVLVYDEGAVAPGAGANVDVKATIFFRHPSTLKVDFLTYPAPVAADVENVGWGKRIKKSAVIDIVDDLSTLAEVTLLPLYGNYREQG